MSVIEMTNVSKIFGFADATTVALDDVDLVIEPGEFVVIMGPSGSGKTTLMNIIGLLDRATHGSYQLDGKEVADLSQRQRAKIRRDQIGFIFQSYNLLPRINVIDNVALPLTYKGIFGGKRLEKAHQLLEQLGIGEKAFYRPNQLSGGQVQRAAIARALINNPSIILADEPTGNLDSQTAEKVMQALSDIHASGNTIVMVTHNPELARYGDRVINMLDGRIVIDNVAGPILEAPAEEITSNSKNAKKPKTVKAKK
jgi:putative ABC transport system ATP-binding protein